MREHIHTDAAFNPDCAACLSAEVERLRDIEMKYDILDRDVKERWTPEVERLREHSRDFQAAWAQAKKDLSAANREVERLRAENVDLEYAAKVIDDEHRTATADRDRVRAVLRQLVEADEAECEYDGRAIAEDSILAQARALVMEE